MGETDDGSRPLYRDLSHSSLENALTRFRAFASAHVDMEPTLRCVRRKDGRRSWVIDVDVRTSPFPKRAQEDDL